MRPDWPRQTCKRWIRVNRAIQLQYGEEARNAVEL